jgi:tetratricopeptide (TPR) repeat protein
MKTRISAVLVPLTILAALLSLPVRGAAQSVLAVRCADVTLDPPSRIQACTAIIQDGASTDMELAVAYTNRGSALDQNGDYKAAIRDFDAALESQPDYAPAFNNRGSAHLSLRQYDRAIPDFDEAIRISPKSAVYYSNRGAAYLDAGDFERAGGDFDRAVLLDPTNPGIWGSRCLVHVIQGDYKDARFDCGRSTTLKVDNLEAWFSNALLYLKTGKAEDAQKAYSSVLYLAGRVATASDSPAAAISFKPSAFYGRGIAEQRRGDLRAAKADIDAALKMDPEVEARFAKWGVRGNDVPDAQDVSAH